MLIVVVPAYNEEKNIVRLLTQFVAVKKSIAFRDILVVDDGSRDSTVAKAESFRTSLPVSVLSLGGNYGPGAAFDRGLKEAVKRARDKDVICTMEADTTSDIAIFPEMLSEVEKGADVVLASCYSPHGGAVLGTSSDRKFLSFVSNTLLRTFFPIPGVYTYSSFYRVYRLQILKALLKKNEKLFTERGLFAWWNY